MWKLMQFLGLDNDDDYDDESEDYVEEQPRSSKKQRSGKRDYGSVEPRLVMFRGVPSESDRLKLRDAFRNGAMILLDLRDLNDRDFEELGRPLVNFMGGVAFASGGTMECIEPAQFIVTPREGMFVAWGEEEPLNDGAFDRQGR